MSKLKVYIDYNENTFSFYRYIWSTFCINKGVDYILVDNVQDSDISTSENNNVSIYPLFSNNFLSLNTNSVYKWETYFKEPIALVNNKPDYWFTAFYLINALQEFNSPDEDNLKRYPYTSSYQKYFNNATDNIVQHCFDKIASLSPLLKPYIKNDYRKSGFLLTHDIDSIYNGWKEDGKHALLNGKPYLFLSLLLQAAIGKPNWFNIDKILSIEKKYGFTSVFYWIAEKGFTNGLPNADYNVSSGKIIRAMKKVEVAGSKNGLHKSLNAKSLKEEWEILKHLNPKIEGHRYHFLKFKWHEACMEIDKAGISFDTSLGFAETIGFRNNYGLPFQPFDLSNKKPNKFVELPLSVMDRTLQQYMKLSTQNSSKAVIDFFESNSNNSIFSVLWHNAFFENYKYCGFPDIYKKILLYFYESNFKCYSQSDIVDQFSFTETN